MRSRPVRRPLGKDGEMCIKEYFMMKNVALYEYFFVKKKFDFLGPIFAKFDQILASVRQKMTNLMPI